MVMRDESITILAWMREWQRYHTPPPPHTPNTHTHTHHPPHGNNFVVNQQYFSLLCQLWTSHSFIPIKEWCRIVKMDLGRNNVSPQLWRCGKILSSLQGFPFELPSCQWAAVRHQGTGTSEIVGPTVRNCHF